MVVQRHTKHSGARVRIASAIAASTAALASLAILASPGLATNSITVGAGGTTVVVNGTEISTSNLTLAQLGQLQGVPASTVKLELDSIAADTPAASAVDALVAGLSPEATLATALDQLSGATGGAISPATALRRVIQLAGQPGAAGGNGSGGAGANGSAGSAGSNGSAPAAVPSKASFTLHVSARSLKGRPGSRVRVNYTVSSAAKLSYGGSKLAKGSRKVGSGVGVLMVRLPRKHGNYRLDLTAISAIDGRSAQASVTLRDSQVKAAKKGHH
jgi:hypothetical protein